MKIRTKLQEKYTFPAMPENIFGMNIFCYAWYELKYSEIYLNGEFEQTVKLLKNSSDKTEKL